MDENDFEVPIARFFKTLNWWRIVYLIFMN